MSIKIQKEKKYEKKIIISFIRGNIGKGIGACGNKTTVSTEGTQELNEVDANTKGEQIVLKNTGWGSPSEKKTTQHVIKIFEKENPNVKVEYVHVPADYNTKLTTMIAAGQGPDVALLNGDTALQWALMEMVTNKVNFGVGIPPKMYDKPITLALGEPVVVFESTKHPKEAWELHKVFMNAQYTMELIEGGLWMPVTKEYYEKEEKENVFLEFCLHCLLCLAF